MPSFTITPVSIAQAESGEFPDYTQYQQDGVNLGDATVDTVNFTQGITATRGVGENANKLEVSAEGGGSVDVYSDGSLVQAAVSGLNFVNATSVTPGSSGVATIELPDGGASPTLAFMLSGSGNAGADISNWVTTSVSTSPDAAWDSTAKTLTYSSEGVYEAKMTVQTTPSASVGSEASLLLVFSDVGNATGPFDLPTGASVLIPTGIVWNNPSTNTEMRFTDSASIGDLVRTIIANWSILENSEAIVIDIAVTVRKLS